MKIKNKISLALLSSILVVSSVNAKEKFIELEGNSRILGEWNMTAEAAALHKKKKFVKNSWEFLDNGTLVAKSLDPRLDAVAQVKVQYTIENGMIRKQSQPGRQKFESCKAVKLEEKEMILHCKYQYYFFTR